MVQKEHPCIALPCAFILSMSVGVALTIVGTPFLSTGAVQVGAAASGLIVGIWFVILAGAWYKRSKDNLLWSLITTGLSWILLGAVISQISQAAMIPFATLTCILLFFFSYKFIELNPETFIPIPRLTAAEVIPEYQQQYQSAIISVVESTQLDEDEEPHPDIIESKQSYEDEDSPTYIAHDGYKRYSDSDKLVHRHIAQTYVVKRKLRDDEVVHHINGNKLDNSSKNLEVMTWREHKELHDRKRWHRG